MHKNISITDTEWHGWKEKTKKKNIDLTDQQVRY